VTFSSRDSIALIIAAGLGAGFAYLSTLAGFGWLIVAGPYAFLVVPCITIYLADQRKLLVWQICIMSFVLYVLADNLRMGRRVGSKDALKIVFVFWATGTIASSPAPLYWYLRRLQGRTRQVACIAAAILAVVLWVLIQRITR